MILFIIIDVICLQDIVESRVLSLVYTNYKMLWL